MQQPNPKDLEAFSEWIQQGLVDTARLAIQTRKNQFLQWAMDPSWKIQIAERSFGKILRELGFQFEAISVGNTELGVWRYSLNPNATDTFMIVPGLGDNPLGWAVWALRSKAIKKEMKEIIFIDFPGFPGLKASYPWLPSFDIQVQSVQTAIQTFKPTILLGHSLGGWLVGKSIELKPEIAKSIQELILVAPSGFMPEEEMETFAAIFKDLHAGESGDAFLRLLAKSPSPLLKFWKPVIENFFQRDSFHQWFSSFNKEHTIKFLPQNIQKVRLVWGDSDQLVPTRWMRYWIESFGTKVDAILLHDCGHIPQMEKARCLHHWFSHRDILDQGAGWKKVLRSKPFSKPTNDSFSSPFAKGPRLIESNL